ncbi:MAG: hypothetical protein WC679_14055 [Bacteroidales bacterium]|jgi:hypothetical protein
MLPYKNMTQELFKSLCWRFGRAFIAGAVSTMVVIMPLSNNSWNDLTTWLSALALAGIVGGISGLIQAIDKYCRSDY